MLRRPRLLVLGPLLAICVGSSTASAEVKLAALIGSNMVLQQGAKLANLGLGRRRRDRHRCHRRASRLWQSRRRRPMASHPRQA